MNYLTAKSDKQLGMCLRMLFSEGLSEIKVKPILNHNHKVEFQVVLDVEESKYNRLKDRFEIMTL